MHSSHDESLIHVTPCQSFEFTEDFSFPEQAMFIQVIVPLGGANETHRSFNANCVQTLGCLLQGDPGNFCDSNSGIPPISNPFFTVGQSATFGDDASNTGVLCRDHC
jgi:hypothetical protein